LIAGNFGASGQSCVAGSRGLVHRSVLEDLAKRVEEKSAGIRIGDPLSPDIQIGPLCTRAQIERAEATLARAVEQGARIRFGGAALDRPGNYMAPTLVECAGPDTETLHVEMFGPVASLLPFDTEEDAIALANDTPFGLGSGIFTQNIARAHRVSARLKAGICWVNTYRAISYMMPFGGVKRSGIGRESGIESIREYLSTKSVWINTSEAAPGNPFVMR
jgi:aldehyde dehydrogenase (NAD+)